VANIFEPSEEEKADWDKWVASRPDAVRQVAKKFKPWKLYRMKSTGHRVTIYSLGEHEDGTVTLTVLVTGTFNKVVAERRVFGIEPEDLEECELPAPDEPLGSLDLPIGVIKKLLDQGNKSN
jgi:hypothetical protein